MMLMSAREWARVIQLLGSHQIPEFQLLASQLLRELNIASPRMTKHAQPTEDAKNQIESDFIQSIADSRIWNSRAGSLLRPEYGSCFSSYQEDLSVSSTSSLGDSESDFIANRSNRYSPSMAKAEEIVTSIGWKGVAVAELRDMNRHRKGFKYTPFSPVGFYAACDQCWNDEMRDEINKLEYIGADISHLAGSYLWNKKSKGYPYWMLLGTQVDFRHTTSLSHWAYMIELRTGMGAHYRYAKHYEDVFNSFGASSSRLQKNIRLGTAEPE
jgi:hypothetical protein